MCGLCTRPFLLGIQLCWPQQSFRLRSLCAVFRDHWYPIGGELLAVPKQSFLVRIQQYVSLVCCPFFFNFSGQLLVFCCFFVCIGDFFLYFVAAHNMVLTGIASIGLYHVFRLMANNLYCVWPLQWKDSRSC